MTDFAIDPPIRISGRRATFVRSTEQGRGVYPRAYAPALDDHAAEVLGRLEDIRSAEEAQEAAQAFRTRIASGLLARADEATE
jgi:hypothetical protein